MFHLSPALPQKWRSRQWQRQHPARLRWRDALEQLSGFRRQQAPLSMKIALNPEESSAKHAGRSGAISPATVHWTSFIFVRTLCASFSIFSAFFNMSRERTLVLFLSM
jgi:hypothetical protein